MTRLQKRINIILFYLLLFIAFVGVIYFMTKPEMTCTDGIKNQGEEKIDCGGPCAPCVVKIKKEDLKVDSIERAEDGKGKEDILIKISNPNSEYGAKSFRYCIYDGVTDGGGSQCRTDFILPDETKYIIVNNYVPQNKGGKLIVKIDQENIDWKKSVNFKDPQLIVYNDKYLMSNPDRLYAELTGLLVNKSSIDYETIKIKGILRDANGDLITASYQVINTLPANGKREFHIIFPVEFSDTVAYKEIEVETNIFDSENYLKARGRQDRWDQ